MCCFDHGCGRYHGCGRWCGGVVEDADLPLQNKRTRSCSTMRLQYDLQMATSVENFSCRGGHVLALFKRVTSGNSAGFSKCNNHALVVKMAQLLS